MTNEELIAENVRLKRELAESERNRREENAALSHELAIWKAAQSATTRHWVYAAAKAHNPLAEKLHTRDRDTGGVHIRWMLDQIPVMSPTKACRWLGWIQASLCTAGVATLEELKTINKAASDAAPSQAEQPPRMICPVGGEAHMDRSPHHHGERMTCGYCQRVLIEVPHPAEQTGAREGTVLVPTTLLQEAIDGLYRKDNADSHSLAHELGKLMYVGGRRPADSRSAK